MDSKLYRGSLETIVFKVLSETDRVYGYEILKTVREKTDDKLKITEGALYPILHRLEADGKVEVEMATVKNRVRKYYKLTEKGLKESVSIFQEMQSYIDTMQNILISSPHPVKI
jgi:PadR family transcriptional regulator, regulatory protein PadR